MRVFMMLTLLMLALLAQAQDNPIVIETKTFIVNQLTDENGGVREELVEATEAIPGQIIEFQMIVTNTGDTTLPASTVTLYGPVPAGTRPIPTSGTPNSNIVQFEFLETDDYLGWRWTVIDPFEPDEVLHLKYRVIMEDSSTADTAG